MEQNFESIESCDQFRSASESVAENQSSKQLPQDSAKDQKSESREEKITGQDFRKNQIKMTEEVELTSDGEKQINRGRDQTEMIKDVILTEEVPFFLFFSEFYLLQQTYTCRTLTRCLGGIKRLTKVITPKKKLSKKRASLKNFKWRQD